jgi:hypothetical protein
VSALASPARFRPGLLPRPLYVCAGASFLIVGAGVAAWNAVERFEHGWWLASFLVLVGGVAQLLLGLGQRALGPQTSTAPTGPARACQAALWNAGTLLVAFGVLADVRLPVVLGSAALLVALCGVARDIGRDGPRPVRRTRRRRTSFVSLLVFLAISVLVGTALAWDLPWL